MRWGRSGWRRVNERSEERKREDEMLNAERRKTEREPEKSKGR